MGATKRALGLKDFGPVSTHAPVMGATVVVADLDAAVAKFQPTRP